MDSYPAVYLGKVVDKKHFRAFVYSQDDKKKLVNSWDEYQKAMGSGVWFALKEDAKARVDVDKKDDEPKQKPKKKLIDELVPGLNKDFLK